ncbi:MAG: endonuclease dU [Candidatus Bathycorpusculaceae bacterium]
MGVEDGSFRKGVAEKALLVVVLFSELRIDAVKVCTITVDGIDATEKLVALLKDWDFDALMLSGVSFAGFNVIDAETVSKRLNVPVIIICRTKPDNRSVKRALQRHFEDWKVRWTVFESLGKVHKITTLGGASPIYVETVRANIEWVYKLLNALAVCSRVPEPIRVARLIARGLS